LFKVKLKTKPKKSLKAKVQRLRGQALWLMIVGAISFLACSLGIFQYWMYGVVSIRPGHQPVSGSDAVELLILLAQSVLCFLLLASYLDSVHEVCRADFRLYQLLKRIGLIHMLCRN
jgi:hypothetical protein